VPSLGSAAFGRLMRTMDRRLTSLITTSGPPWNKGYGTEAMIAVIGHGLGSIGLDRIVAVAMAGNVGSWRVMEKSGMRYEGFATYSGMAGLKKYAAERQWWQPPHSAPGS
jgi:RimJ/RimL family protein N-acetyltransferase